jgi:hypothetical protein
VLDADDTWKETQNQERGKESSTHWMPLQETQTKVQKLVHTYCGPWIMDEERREFKIEHQRFSAQNARWGKRLTIPLQLTHLRLGGSLRSPRTTRSFRSSSFLDPAAIALAEPKRRTGLVGGRRRSLDPPCLSPESSAISTRAEQTPESRWWRCACL